LLAPLKPFDPARSFVARLQWDLKSRGFEVWFDRVSMPSRRLTFHQEIRDAVAACDRLLVVIGPKAVSSDYVRQEWQFAYFQADKVVTPILRSGEFSLVPDELKLLHCEDFRDNAQYEFHLEQLARILCDPIPQLGKLIGVPSLPAHFLSRTDRLVAIRDALRADLDRPVVITGAVPANRRSPFQGSSFSQVRSTFCPFLLSFDLPAGERPTVHPSKIRETLLDSHGASSVRSSTRF
jgi:hypothetical protein